MNKTMMNLRIKSKETVNQKLIKEIKEAIKDDNKNLSPKEEELNNHYKSFLIKCQQFEIDNLQEQIDVKICETKSMKFADWLLENATSYSDNGIFMWQSDGKYYATSSLYKIFVEQNSDEQQII